MNYILLILLAVLLFGGRLPAMARSVGMGISEFKKGMWDA